MGSYNVKLSVILAPVTIDRSKPLLEVRRLFSDSSSEDSKTALALTYSTYGSSGRYDLDTGPSGNGYCARVTGGNIWFYFRRTIFMPREIEAGSCVDLLLLHHERQHIAIAEDAAENELVSFLKARFTGPAPGVENKYAGVAEDQVKAVADKILSAAFDQYTETLEVRQRLFDKHDDVDIDKACGKGALARFGL